MLALALSQVTSNPSHERYDQIWRKLEREPRFKVAWFAASCAQSKNLHLATWQLAPCDIDDAEQTIALGEGDPDYKTALLLRDMLAQGISKFHPDPLSVLRNVSKT